MNYLNPLFPLTIGKADDKLLVDLISITLGLIGISVNIYFYYKI